MELRKEILAASYKEQVLAIAGWVGNDAKRFAKLMQLFLEDEYRVVQRSAWIISLVADKHPELLTPHLPEMVARMETGGLPSAVKRNVLRVLQDMTLPPDLHGPVMNACFQYLEDPKEMIAIKAFSMTVLSNLAVAYPDIKNEIRILLEDLLEHDPSPGIRSRAQKVMKRIG
ncbi:hypothetical protein SAMN04488128_107226 [Chitinophaga eiseniae]|uniref:HEAT repeat-containing protein n=1 Tax=Chitinophaga eiseniae TaxID=634771 RepID=A0A1T4U151_9BACT|nr:hypothetical protein [Chitinophaga eiseniae]SKA46219.1 hypothetical protein SAMN04488128_107226 [Chitinophaga eiseniae]